MLYLGERICPLHLCISLILIPIVVLGPLTFGNIPDSGVYKVAYSPFIKSVWEAYPVGKCVREYQGCGEAHSEEKRKKGSETFPPLISRLFGRNLKICGRNLGYKREWGRISSCGQLYAYILIMIFFGSTNNTLTL